MHKYNTSSVNTGINNDEAEYTHPNWMSACKYRSGNICVKNKEWCILSWPFTEEELLSLWFIEEIDIYTKSAERILWNYWSVYCDNNIKDLSVQLRKYFPEEGELVISMKERIEELTEVIEEYEKYVPYGKQYPM